MDQSRLQRTVSWSTFFVLSFLPFAIAPQPLAPNLPTSTVSAVPRSINFTGPLRDASEHAVTDTTGGDSSDQPDPQSPRSELG